MTRLLLAICPSNQDRNPVLGGPGNEMEHIAPLASALLAAVGRYPGIVAQVFTASPESADSYPHRGLYAQQRAAAEWIRANRQPGDLTVCLNLHSDSGSQSHCGYFFDSDSGPVSEWLGRAITEAIKGWFGGRVLSADYGKLGYIFAYMVRADACPLLLEVGAHTVPADVEAVRQHASEIAGLIADTLASFFGLGTPPLDTSELRTYPEWALARLAGGQDGRDLAAFREHLAAIGADASSPISRYGVPVS